MARTLPARGIVCVWPGLERLWREGHVPSLAAAIAFSVGLNLALWAVFIRSEPLARSWAAAFGLALAAGSAVGVWRGRSTRSPVRNGLPDAHQEDLFIRAQTEYLRGHWVEAQTLLEERVRSDPWDMEAHVLLASVFRRSGRIELSCKQLRQIQGLPEAAAWRFEVGRELALLKNPPGRDS